MHHKLFFLRFVNILLAGIILTLLCVHFRDGSGESAHPFSAKSGNTVSSSFPAGDSASGEIRTDSNSTVSSYFPTTASSKNTSQLANADQSSDNSNGNQASASEKKQVALTFDDGPDGTYTPMLLDGLKERNVKATFFLLGAQIRQYPEIVTRMYDEGHLIGCHSYEHINFTQISEADACKQITDTCDLLYALTGERSSFVRPPYGAWPSCLDDDLCMISVLWDVDPLDWATDDASLITERILTAVEEYDIILLHDASASSVQAALQVIDTLLEEDYTFVTVEELLLP